MASAMEHSSLRERPKSKRVEHVVRIEVPNPTRYRDRLEQQRVRVLKFQRRWQRIKDDLPPQLSRRQSEWRLEILYGSC